MLRRFTTVVLIWIGLLAVALPAFGCSPAVLNCDCCPADGSAACSPGEMGIIHPEAAAALCCVDQSMALRPVASELRRPLDERKFPRGSPDPATLVTGSISRSASRSGDLIFPAEFVRSDGTSIYLHTARLRL